MLFVVLLFNCCGFRCGSFGWFYCVDVMKNGGDSEVGKMEIDGEQKLILTEV